MQEINCYIKFDESIVLPFYPDGFTLNKSDNTINYWIKFYDEKGRKKEKNEIEKEIENVTDSLKIWAERLPDFKE